MHCITDSFLFLLNQLATAISCINDSQIQTSDPKLSLKLQCRILSPPLWYSRLHYLIPCLRYLSDGSFPGYWLKLKFVSLAIKASHDLIMPAYPGSFPVIRIEEKTPMYQWIVYSDSSIMRKWTLSQNLLYPFANGTFIFSHFNPSSISPFFKITFPF